MLLPYFQSHNPFFHLRQMLPNEYAKMWLFCPAFSPKTFVTLFNAELSEQFNFGVAIKIPPSLSIYLSFSLYCSNLNLHLILPLFPPLSIFLSAQSVNIEDIFEV